MQQSDIHSFMMSSIEKELNSHFSRIDHKSCQSFLDMLTYHMGWTGEGSGPDAKGKRLRPLLLLLVTSAAGGDWHSSLPAAAAIELIHNFSLIHDDIQDGSSTRRGRLTVWNKWGVPMAINAGDALFSLASLAIADLIINHPPNNVLRASQILHAACLCLTKGQFLDMEFQEISEISLDNYWQMIDWKTASLFSACCEIGSLLGGADSDTVSQYSNFGRSLGLAFQLQDDYLGIWGLDDITGKSAVLDLESGKKTFPILYGLERKGEFSRIWNLDNDKHKDIYTLSSLLEKEGAKSFTSDNVDRLLAQACEQLNIANPQGHSRVSILNLLNDIAERNK